MTSTSSSLNGASLALELVDSRGVCGVFPLVDVALGEAGIASEGSVADRGRYRVAVLSDVDVGPATVTVSVGDDVVQADCAAVADGGPYRYRYGLGAGETRLFADVLGFAVVLVSVSSGTGAVLCGKTERIACACALSDIRAFAGGMLAQLRSDALAPALRMMSLQGACGPGPRPRSLEALCAMAEEVLGVFAAEAGALKARPRVKTCREGVLVRPESVRRLGREEVCWLVEGRSGAAWRTRGDGSRELAARRVMCAVPAKSCDNPENRAVLAFVAQAARSMARLQRAVAGAVAELLDDRDMICRAVGAAGSVPTVMLIDEQVADAGRVETRLRDARRGFSRLARGLSRAWGVEPPARFAMPVRSKTFVEVPHYARVWSAMRAWDSFGQVDELSQASLWSLRSLSALHELFCLAKLSSWFASHGFELAESSLVRVPGASPRPDRPEVRNAYVFERAGLVLRLWYQPVFYGDVRDEFGCGAHRTSASRFGGDGVWTPDFAIEARQGGTQPLLRPRREVLRARARLAGPPSRVRAQVPPPDGARGGRDRCRVGAVRQGAGRRLRLRPAVELGGGSGRGPRRRRRLVGDGGLARRGDGAARHPARSRPPRFRAGPRGPDARSGRGARAPVSCRPSGLGGRGDGPWASGAGAGRGGLRVRAARRPSREDIPAALPSR